jgi:hypothetical protein
MSLRAALWRSNLTTNHETAHLHYNKRSAAQMSDQEQAGDSIKINTMNLQQITEYGLAVTEIMFRV